MHHFRLSADQNGLQTIYRQIETENLFSRSMFKSNRHSLVDKSRVITWVFHIEIYTDRLHAARARQCCLPWSLSYKQL